MTLKKESQLLAKLFSKIAPKLGVQVLVEPEWNIVGKITFKSGKNSYFRYNTIDLNPVGASDIAKDKDYANFFMERMGYPIVPMSKTFYSPEWSEKIGAQNRSHTDALIYAQSIGFPVVVKPNSGSQGVGISFVFTKRELDRALQRVFQSDRIALLQKPVRGKDCRIVVLDNEVISAYERIPLSVTGDGVSTIEELLVKKQAKFVKKKRDTQIKFDDPRILLKLKRQKLSFASIVPKGTQVFLLDNANLSTGGDSIDVTESIHPKFKKLAVKLTRDMGLRLCGVDLVVAGDITKAPKEYWVLEINAAPGLDHYARGGKKQAKIVEELYTKVLKALDK